MSRTYMMKRNHSLTLLLCIAKLFVAFSGCSDAPVAKSAGAAENESKPKETSTNSAAAAVLPPDLGTRPTGTDWAAFLGPTGDGKSSEKGLIAPWPEKGPKLVWQIPTGVGYGMPAVSRGRLFQFDMHREKARLTCMKAESAESLWQFEYTTDYQDMYGYDNGPRCQPVVDGDMVYTFGAEGMLHALRVADGSVVWKVDTTKSFGVVQNFFGVGSTPIVEGNLLLVQVGGSTPETAGGSVPEAKPSGTGIVAFDKRTGEVKYKVGAELASYASPIAATIGGKRYGFLFARGGLLAFDPATGRENFHFPWRAASLESVNASNPVVVGDQVFISETYGPGSALLKVKPDGYDVVWSDLKGRREKRMQTHWNTAIEVDGFLYGSSGRHTNNAELRCVEVATGNVMWSEPDLTRSSLTYVDGHFICLTEYGELILIKANSQKYDVVSKFTPLKPDGGVDPTGLGPARLLAYPAWAAPTIAHGLMYVRGKDRLACYEIISK
jgi:outer membrane protein assembly factor BamB